MTESFTTLTTQIEQPEISSGHKIHHGELFDGRYLITGTIGAGGMGSVLEAQDTKLGRKVAIKVPRGEAMQEPIARERFIREARTAASLSHPNICQVYDFGSYKSNHFIVMGYVAGDPLTSLIGDPSITDHLKHKGQSHTYRCRQILTVNEQHLIAHIRHDCG